MQSSDAPGWTPLPLPSPGAGPSQPTVGILSLPSTSATPSAGARPSTGRNAPRKRLPQEAYELLTDYYDNVNQYPQRSECIMLADRIRKMPGCDDYTPDKVKQYFGTKRYTKGNTRARTGTKPSGQPRDVKPQVAQHQAFVNSAHILYPSLASEPSILSKLDILLSETPDPTPNVAQIWASRLAVVAADIITYAELRRAQTQPAKVSMGPGANMHAVTPC
ncbi:hypothetical protein C8Q78DRAFT_26500 [Trametes maxima]|nr:hypothetical protein C8Q78DRAFT_26500 [Trametes maxima]